uniref:Uncharacterized protein n=1 Tax=Panagrolaimus sp. JU765 TaxID=591449 RepID=A0AC34RP17_9BILA
MDDYRSSRHYNSSSSNTRRDYKHERGYDRDDRKRRRSRSKSRSPRYSSYLRQGKTRNELEIEIELLQNENKDLRAQIHQLNANITNCSVAQVQAESRAAHWEGEVNRINVGYQQCTNVLKSLKAEYETLAREKQKWLDEVEKYKKERDIADKSADNFRDQMSVISERNTTLVKKCEEVVLDNKNYKDKQIKYEVELRELRPALANLESDLEKIKKENKNLLEENQLFKEKEKTWIAEKKEMEKRILIKDVKGKAKQGDGFTEDVYEIEKIKKLEMVIDSLHSHYETQLKMLEQQLGEGEYLDDETSTNDQESTAN